MDDYDLECEAARMAEAINGGSWDVDYTEPQKQGWRSKARWRQQEVDLYKNRFFDVQDAIRRINQRVFNQDSSSIHDLDYNMRVS